MEMFKVTGLTDCDGSLGVLAIWW